MTEGEADVAFTVRLMKASGRIDSNGVTRYTRIYQVESDEINDAPGAVVAAGSLASFAYLSPHPDDSHALLKEKTAEQDGELMVWTVTFNWDTEQSQQDRGTVAGGTGSGPLGTSPTHPSSPGTNHSGTHPEVRPNRFEWGSVQTNRYLPGDLTLDEDGDPAPRPFASSAGQVFDPPPQIDCSDTTLSITCYRMTARPEKIWLYQNSVNDNDFLGIFPADWIRVTSYKQTSVYEAQWGWFWEYQITLQIREDGWNPVKVMDAGTVQRIDVPPFGLRLTPCLDAHGHPVTSPVPLDGFGAQLPLTAGPEDIVYLKFQGYKRLDFFRLIDGT